MSKYSIYQEQEIIQTIDLVLDKVYDIDIPGFTVIMIREIREEVLGELKIDPLKKEVVYA